MYPCAAVEHSYKLHGIVMQACFVAFGALYQDRCQGGCGVFYKSSIPIAAGADFYAYIPIDIDTTDVIWAFPVLTDAPGDNCTKINISTCVWQDASKQIYVNGCNLASGAANISLTGVLIAIR